MLRRQRESTYWATATPRLRNFETRDVRALTSSREENVQAGTLVPGSTMDVSAQDEVDEVRERMQHAHLSDQEDGASRPGVYELLPTGDHVYVEGEYSPPSDGFVSTAGAHTPPWELLPTFGPEPPEEHPADSAPARDARESADGEDAGGRDAAEAGGPPPSGSKYYASPDGKDASAAGAPDASAAAGAPASAPSISVQPPSRIKFPPHRGILRRSTTQPSGPLWTGRELVSTLQHRVAEQGVGATANQLLGRVLRRLGGEEPAATPGSAPSRHAQPLQLKAVHFRFEDLSHVYPIEGSIAPGEEHATFRRVEKEYAELVQQRKHRLRTPAELEALYRMCCAVREEPPLLPVTGVFAQAAAWSARGANVLDFSSVNLAQHYRPVADLLSVPVGVRRVVLEHCALTDAALTALAHAVLVSGTVQHLSVAENAMLRNAAWRALGALVQNSGALLSLDVSENAVSKQGLRLLLHALLDGSSGGRSGPPPLLQTLRLEHCRLSSASLQVMAQAVRASRLRHLSLRRNELQPLAGEPLALALRDHPDINNAFVAHLDARNGGAPAALGGGSTDVYASSPPGPVLTALIGEAEAARIAAEMPQQRVPVEEQCRRLMRRAQTFQNALARAPRISSLITLDLKGNALRTGVAPLATALRCNRTLRVLNLGENRLEPGELVALSDALLYNTTLETLDVSGNPSCCGPALDGVLHLRTALAVHPGLRRVFLQATGLRAQGAVALAECLPQARALLHLDLSRNAASNVAALIALTAGTELSKSLRCVDVSVGTDDDHVLGAARSLYDACRSHTEAAHRAATSDSARRLVAVPLQRSALAAALRSTGHLNADESAAPAAEEPPSSEASHAAASAGGKSQQQAPAVSIDTSVPSVPLKGHESPSSPAAARAHGQLSEEGAIFRKARSRSEESPDEPDEPPAPEAADPDKSGEELRKEMLERPEQGARAAHGAPEADAAGRTANEVKGSAASGDEAAGRAAGGADGADGADDTNQAHGTSGADAAPAGDGAAAA